MDAHTPFVRTTRIAYVSVEIALRLEMHTYSGSLGVLAGDTARSCADLELPIVFVTLLSRDGYLRQEIGGGRQVEHPDPWTPSDWCTPLRAKVAIKLEGRDVWVRPWLFVLEGATGFRIPILLLDSDLAENAPEDRRLTDRLYGGDATYRLKQEALLGIAGRRLLVALGFDIHVFHLNEGHAALLALDRLLGFPKPAEEDPAAECPVEVADDAALCASSLYDMTRVRAMCIFTTHTPVAAGHDRFPFDLVRRVLRDDIALPQLQLLAGSEDLNMTRLALTLAGYVNGVAKRHAETAGTLFEGYRLHAVTNGVHAATWTDPGLARLFDARFPPWRHESEVLSRADELPDADVWAAHREATRRLIKRVTVTTGVRLTTELPILGFARRMTAYKLPTLIFHDLERLVAPHGRHPFQLVFAGKTHSQDVDGKRLIEAIHGVSERLRTTIPVAFMPDYNVDVSRDLVAGCDVWLNTPKPPLEASGTSGMKAAFNGVLNLSVPDGWWAEACAEGRTGWAIGTGAADSPDAADADALYTELE